MKIIDFERKGNVIRFYLGEKTPTWGWTNEEFKDSTGNTPDYLKPSDTYYGDDWNDIPYEHNAEKVYDRFIRGYKDIYFDFDDLVVEPYEGDYYDSKYCKNDMVARRIPCIIVVPKKLFLEKNLNSNNFFDLLGVDGIKKYYFGDEINTDIIKIVY